MSRLPLPPDDPAVLAAGFPVLVWPAQQPLSRVHRATRCSVHYATDADGRFNPPSPSAGFGSCYASSHPRGAFAEALGRFRVLTR